MRSSQWICALIFFLSTCQISRAENDTSELIGWLLEDGRDLKGIPFSEVLTATTGKKIIPIDPITDKTWLDALGAALDRTLLALNESAPQIHNTVRINEASRFIEDQLRTELNKQPGWHCSIPTIASGEEQRSGYPDMRLVLPDGPVVYIDPKLFSHETRSSTLRTFYYEPKSLTNKVHDDAKHVLVGIQHNEKTDAELRLLAWELVDISRIRVQLKAEFQAPNKELYHENNVIRRSANP